MASNIYQFRDEVDKVVDVGIVNADVGRVVLSGSNSGVLAFNVSLRGIPKIIISMFSLASALYERRREERKEHSVFVLPAVDAASQRVNANGQQLTVISLRFGHEAIFRFSLPPEVIERLLVSLSRDAKQLN